jgi:type VI protein secretion system component VasA
MLDTNKHIFWLVNKKLNKQQTQYETTVSFISDNVNFNNRILYAKLLCYQQNANAFVAKESSWNAPNNLGNINCINLERPTQSYMPILNSRSQWRLISHLSIDHFGFENSNTLKYIKELLAIYDFQNLNNKNAMNYLKELKYEIDMVSYNRCLVPKANLIIKADDVYSSPVFLLSHIIGKFFSQIMNFNTKFDVILKKNSNEKTWKKWNLI